MAKTRKGMTDLPILDSSSDQFNISAYTNGLVDFIRKCETPLTISLQGDWGTGKTSFINLVSKKLINEKIFTITFNTWRYSQFNLKDNLAICFLNYLIDSLVDEEECKKADKIQKAKKMLSSILRIGITMSTACLADGVNVFDNMNNADNQDDFFNDPSKLVESLKEIFEEAIKKKLDSTNSDRIVIFIDDLDRLDPKIAVNLLEVIKLFLDIENCVFVLAIDYSIVSEGIREKFGDHVSNDKMQSFFDKIIQVPFKIPTEFYDFHRLITESLGERIKNDKNLKNIQDIIKLSVGNNPRAVKRLINSFYLIINIIEKIENEKDINESKNTLLLTILCMQLSYEPLYKYFCDNMQQHEELFKKNNEEYLGEVLREYSEKELSDKYIRKISIFIDKLGMILLSLVNKEKEDEIEEADIQFFLEVLVYSDMTSEKNDIYNNGNIKITLDELNNMKTKGLKCVGIELENEKSPNTTFSQSFIWALGRIIQDDRKYKEKLENIYEMYSLNIPSRIYLPMIKMEFDTNEEKLKAKSSGLYDYYKDSVANGNLPAHKKIENTKIDLVTHYSSIDLSKNLSKLIEYIGYDKNKVSIIISKV